MNFLERKKIAFMTIANSVKGFLRKATGTSSLTLEKCVDDKSLVSLSITGNSDGVGATIPFDIHSMNMLNFSSFVKVAGTDAIIDKINKTITIPYSNGNARAVEQSSDTNQPCTVGKYTVALNATRYPVRLIVSIYDSNHTLLTSGFSGGSYLAYYKGFYAQNSTGIFNFEVTNPDAAYISFGFSGLTAYGEGNSTTLLELMFLQGTYSRAALPDYEDYTGYTTANITLNNALGADDVLTLNYTAKTADINGTDITTQIDWNNVPQTYGGVTTIITATSSVLPTAMSADYYSSVKGE